MYHIKKNRRTATTSCRTIPRRSRLTTACPPRRSRGRASTSTICAELEGRPSDADWFDKLARKIYDNGGGMVTGPGGVGNTQGLLKAFRELLHKRGASAA